jgi:anti-sigma-K factor RskA
VWGVLAILLSGPLGYYLGFRKARAQREAEAALARSLAEDAEFRSTLLTYLQLLDEWGAEAAASALRPAVEHKVAERIRSIPAGDRIWRSLRQDSEIGRARYLQHLMIGAAWELHHSPLEAVV